MPATVHDSDAAAIVIVTVLLLCKYSCCCFFLYSVHKTGSEECTECTKFICKNFLFPSFLMCVCVFFFGDISRVYFLFRPEKYSVVVRFMHPVYGWIF